MYNNFEVITLADSILRDKAKEFAKTIVFLCRDMKGNCKESVLINQLLRSATSIGANLHEHNTHKEQRILFLNLNSTKRMLRNRILVRTSF